MFLQFVKLSFVIFQPASLEPIRNNHTVSESVFSNIPNHNNLAIIIIGNINSNVRNTRFDTVFGRHAQILVCPFSIQPGQCIFPWIAITKAKDVLWCSIKKIHSLLRFCIILEEIKIFINSFIFNFIKSLERRVSDKTWWHCQPTVSQFFKSPLYILGKGSSGMVLVV